MKIAVGMMAVLAAVSTCSCAQDTANPVVTSANEIVQRQSKFMVAAAEEMPEAKYSYTPTLDQWTYGQIL